MNPEEGELRPQLLDRFGLCVTVEGEREPEKRVAVMERRADFEKDPLTFASRFKTQSDELGQKIEAARKILPNVKISRDLLFEIARYCLQVGVDGHRGDILVLKTAKTIAAWNQRDEVDNSDIREAAELALPHRVRREPLMAIADNLEKIRRGAAKENS
jgi:magnesium chelatase subunit I